MSLSIRSMTPDDWDAVSSIYTQALIAGKSAFTDQCPDYETWNKSYLPNCRFVIESDGKAAGWCAILPTSPKEAYRGVVEVSIYIDEAYQGKGCGAALLNYLIAKAKEEGCWCLYSAIISINKASIALHEKCGFRHVGYRERIAQDRFGVWQNTTIMEKRL